MNINNNIFLKDEQEVANSLLNSINFNSNKNELTYFLSEIEQKVLNKLINFKKYNLKIEFFGGTFSSERRRAKLICNEYYDIDFNIVCLKATFSNKFNEIKHSDVLGAIYNSGISYNRIGDIIVKENNVFIFVDSVIADYLVMNFSKIGRTHLKFEIVYDILDLQLEKEYEEFIIVCSSLRLDNVVAKITNKSRSKAKELIEKEFVKVNHIVLPNVEKICSIDDVISIRKYGRYTLKSNIKNLKTSKNRITVAKLI